MENALMHGKSSPDKLNPTNAALSGVFIDCLMTPMQFAEITDLIFMQSNRISLLSDLVRYLANGHYGRYASVYYVEYDNDMEHFLFSTGSSTNRGYVEKDSELRVSNKRCGGCISGFLQEEKNTQKPIFQCRVCQNAHIDSHCRILRIPMRTEVLCGVLTITQDKSCRDDFNFDVLIHAISLLVVEKVNALFLKEKVEQCTHTLVQQRPFKELGENATYAIHETKNLASVIYGGVQLARSQIEAISNDKDNRFTPNAAKAFLALSEAISISNRAGEKFVNVLNDWKSNLTSKDRRAVLLNSLVQNAISEAKIYCGAPLKYIYEDGGDELYLKTNPVLLDRAITNIILNAIHAVKDTSNPTITIHLHSVKDGQSCRLTVKDNGGGISKDKIADIMENRSPDQELPSFCGKGMWITKAILDNLGGVLSITNTKPKGTEVSIEIPTLDTCQAEV